MERKNENLSLTIDGFLRGTLSGYWQGSGGVFTVIVFCEEEAQGKQYASLTHMQVPTRRHSAPLCDGRDPFFCLILVLDVADLPIVPSSLSIISSLCSHKIVPICLFSSFLLFSFCARDPNPSLPQRYKG